MYRNELKEIDVFILKVELINFCIYREYFVS